MKTQLETRQQLEEYIKKNIPFYKCADLCLFTIEQLKEVIKRYQKKING